jgi:hypothetical protein
MVPERVFEIGSFDWHCISCGERIDPVILAHRKKDPQSIEAEKVSADKAESSLQLSSLHSVDATRHGRRVNSSLNED